jgi:hypothetical protein
VATVTQPIKASANTDMACVNGVSIQNRDRTAQLAANSVQRVSTDGQLFVNKRSTFDHLQIHPQTLALFS